ncbi:MAG TPA: 2Fe-2S iron-sulfur cluster-binding protein [Candidatus Dormibacteraeota bacterium]|nr:2Fe-2S iron-sulfur cluster-binding protein [Candidatus Dormibacteraeota bacterium]
MPESNAARPVETVTLTIDGQQVTVPKGTLVVEAAKKVDIEIPVFCYHHKLDPVGACRLCLVEISPGPPRPQTACTTPAAEGMVVRTNSPLAVAARADILEYELVNHPLDCPVCDKGGECPLQDYTFRHGYPTSRVDSPRVHFQKPIPLSDRIALDRERCVLCYRCTRYYDEIAWEQELTVDHRGIHSFITSQFGQPLRSVFSGNIIDLCPVGALTSRVWRFESRPWDMRPTASVCATCAVGCNTTLWERRNQLVRVTSRENDDIDEGWICDRGRFEYTQVNDPARLHVPMVGGRHASWEEALTALVEATAGRGRRLGISLPQDVTNEELYLLSRLLAGPWKGARVTLERRTLLPPPPPDTLPIRDLDTCRAVVVVASDTADDVPIVNLRVKKAVKKLGARLLIVHPRDLDLDRWPHAVHVRPEPGGAAAAVRALSGHELLGEGPVGILWGDGRGTEDVGELAAAVAELAAAVGGRQMPLYRATNERGALAAGVVGPPDDLDGCEAVICWGPPPSGRIPAGARFVAVWDVLLRPEHGRPDVVLPDLSFAETQGSYTNLEGRVQFVRPALVARPPLREGWEVLTEIGQRLGVAGMEYVGIFQVQREAARAIPAFAPLAGPPDPEPEPTPVLYGPARP